MPDCFVRSGILELMVMVVNLVFDNHPFTYAGKMASIRMRAVSRSWRRSHIDGLRHSRDADRLVAHAADLDVTRAEAALQRALRRLDVAEKYGKQ